MITVYIDVLFAVNFLINILIVEGTGLIISTDTKWYRSLSSALVGAVYATLAFFPGMEFIEGVVMKILLSAVMVMIAFGFKTRAHFLKMWGSFYVASFIFGGSLIAIMSLTGLGSRLGAIYSNGSIYLNLPWRWVFATAAGTYMLIFFFGKIRKRKIAKEAVARKLTIFINGSKIEIKAIIDTGNSLTDPITGSPVIVCEYGQIKSLVPINEGESLIEKMREAGLKVRLIPFSSIGNESDIMPAFLPDMVKIDEYVAKRCVIGITRNNLSVSEDYHALLNPTMVVK
ncbi:MAG: sigma-E processing peptidase SpoIIGA [Clostridia bacterium]|nr:sigma-E processing peptidase SpoIIGA [Clostridia bacterium]